MDSRAVQILFALCLALVGATAQGTCGDTGKRCIQDKSECVEGACVCSQPFVWGDPYFMCYKKNQVAAESKNDPSLTTFNNETTEFPFPCRYLMTHLRQELKDRSKTVIGTCDFMVHAFNTRSRGKIVTHGFDIAVKVSYNDGTTVDRSARKFGTAVSGDNILTVNSVHDYVPDGPWTPSVDILYKDKPNGIKIECYEDPDNSQIVFEFRACGLRVTFVPYDAVLRRDQEHIPGLSVGVNSAHHPKWLSNHQVIGLAPKFQGGQLISEILKPGLTESQSLVDRAFLSRAQQNQPDAHPSCTRGAFVLASCTDAQRASAYNACYWMLSEAKYLKCINTGKANFIHLFVDCVAAWCQGKDCYKVIYSVKTRCKHVQGVPKLTQFLAGSLCPP